MATAAVAVKRPKVHPDRLFFPALCGLLLLTVWLGFSKTYYAAGMVRTTLPSGIIHVHAAAATLWLITLIVQIGLVTARKVKLHMAVGLWGFGLAGAMVILGLVAARDSLRRGLSPPGSGLDSLTFFVVPISDIVLFACFAGWSYLVRRKPLEHKRLIMLATIVIVDAAIGRFPGTVWPGLVGIKQSFLLFGFLLVMMVYDLVTLKKIHRVTWLPSVVIVVVHLTRIPLAMTGPWLEFARWVRG